MVSKAPFKQARNKNAKEAAILDCVLDLDWTLNCSGHVQPRQGTEICNFGAPSPLEALHWIFCLFSSIHVRFSKTSPLKSGESSEKSSGENRVKSCQVWGCHGFFGPELRGATKGEEGFVQHQPKGNNLDRHLTQHLYGACVVALLSVRVEKVL